MARTQNDIGEDTTTCATCFRLKPDRYFIQRAELCGCIPGGPWIERGQCHLTRLKERADYMWPSPSHSFPCKTSPWDRSSCRDRLLHRYFPRLPRSYLSLTPEKKMSFWEETSPLKEFSPRWCTAKHSYMNPTGVAAGVRRQTSAIYWA
jgi:hypothetical protein